MQNLAFRKTGDTAHPVRFALKCSTMCLSSYNILLLFQEGNHMWIHL